MIFENHTCLRLRVGSAMEHFRNVVPAIINACRGNQTDGNRFHVGMHPSFLPERKVGMIIEDRPYQRQCVDAVMEHFRNGIRAVMLEAPVGSGKTIMGLMIAALLQRMSPGKKLSCAWVAPRHTLLDQLVEANRYFGLSVTPVSMFARTARHYDIVVLDEAHHEATNSFIQMFQLMSPNYLLGLSATPLRTDKMKLAFNETVNLCSIRSLIADDYLSRFQVFSIDSMTPESAAEHYLRSPEKWGKTIVFMPTLEECRRFRELLFAKGVECPVVAGNTNNDYTLESFRRRNLKIVVNCHLLSEGFDLPDLQTVFLKDASRLPTVQMAGRVLRKHPGKRLANIVQSKQTRYPVQKIANPETVWNWSGDRFYVVSGRNDRIRDIVLQNLRQREARGELKISKFWSSGPAKEKVYV